MPHFIQQINNPGGALITVLIGVSKPRATALQNSGQSIPSVITAQGLIDTGASGLCIDSTIAQQLLLQPTGTAPMLTPSTGNIPQIVPVYDISLRIPHDGSSLDFGSVPAVESILLNQGFGVLIGREVLSRCLLIYDGVIGYFTLSF